MSLVSDKKGALMKSSDERSYNKRFFHIVLFSGILGLLGSIGIAISLFQSGASIWQICASIIAYWLLIGILATIALIGPLLRLANSGTRNGAPKSKDPTAKSLKRSTQDVAD